MTTILWIIVAIILVVIFVIALYRAIKMSVRVVPQEKRLVIYQLGTFSRVAGPGPVRVIPGLDQVVKTIEVRDHLYEVTVPGVFAYGVPNELTLSLWCSFDLVQAAAGDRDKLMRFVQVSEAERRDQVRVKMHEALVRQIAGLQERMPLPDKATLLERVVALAPGSPRYNEFLKCLKYDLDKVLPSIGVVVSAEHPIVLTGRNISDEIIGAIKRRHGRELDSEWLMNYAQELRRRFPGMSNTMLAQILLSIEGIDVGRIQKLLLEQEEGAQAEVEFEMSGAGESGPNVIAKPKPKPQKHEAVQVPQPLKSQDWDVLKPVPRADGEQRLSA
jgi:hypothetical protein